tara:strand:+ start:1679 stop:1957 length:279 start_codon:yes stop_codon:yes gene_type:complete
MAITRGQMSKQISKPPAKKKTKRKIPPKYLKGLSSTDKAKRRKEIQRNAPKADNDPSAYKFSTDFDKKGKRRKTKESVYTKKFRKMYGGKKK